MGSSSLLLSATLYLASFTRCLLCGLKLQHQMQSQHTYWDCFTSSGQILITNIFLYTERMQSVFIICGFYIYKFTYSLKFICNPKINMAVFQSFTDTHMCRVVKKIESLSLAKVEQGHTLPSYFSSHTVNKCPFPGDLVSRFSYFCDFSVSNGPQI